MARSLDQVNVETLRGVGPQLAAKLCKLGLRTLQDLLFHLPLRYIDRTQITAIGGIQPMTEVVIEGEVRASDVVFGRRRSLVCRLQDHTGVITLRFFHFSRAQQERLAPACAVLVKCGGANQVSSSIIRSISIWIAIGPPSSRIL